MSKKYYDECPYCDVKYRVEFDDDDDIVANCPACGEQVPAETDESDGWYEYEDEV